MLAVGTLPDLGPLRQDVPAQELLLDHAAARVQLPDAGGGVVGHEEEAGLRALDVPGGDDPGHT